MTQARPVLPTDLLALVSYNGRSYKNEAWTRERLGADESGNTLGLVLDQFLAFARARSAWISVRRQRLQGLVGARRRGGRQAWEIDYLIDATPGRDAVLGLLECAISEAGNSGAEKLFLRLDSGSELLTVARRAGFMPYQEELLYAKQQGTGNKEQEPSALRRVEPSDSYALYRLYNATTPEVTRRSEAATFAEWHAAQERRWMKQGLQLLAETDGRISATVRGAKLPQGVLAELTLADADCDAEGVVNALAQALGAEATRSFVLVPSTSEGLANQLQDAGYTPHQEFVSMVRRTARTLKLPKLLPAIAKSVSA
ncbi:MAG TPA: hypothetical protein VJB57_13955 [Dehalococcoidia bacterium]|nr:hypothetical protein [Dehalococcoidia bacterium]